VESLSGSCKHKLLFGNREISVIHKPLGVSVRQRLDLLLDSLWFSVMMVAISATVGVSKNALTGNAILNV
jgi:hypothetical protein